MNSLRVTYQGPTLQGTGHLAGVRQCFVRLAGCRLASCHLRSVCDESLSLSTQSGSEYSFDEILARALTHVGDGGWLHVTGGEPTDSPHLFQFLELAKSRGLRIHLQTHGGNRVPLGVADWLTVSPKVPLADLRVTERLQGEMIVVYDGQPLQDLAELHRETSFGHYWLQPKWRGNATVGSIVFPITELGKLGIEWRGAVQAHKYWRCP